MTPRSHGTAPAARAAQSGAVLALCSHRRTHCGAQASRVCARSFARSMSSSALLSRTHARAGFSFQSVYGRLGISLTTAHERPNGCPRAGIEADRTGSYTVSLTASCCEHCGTPLAPRKKHMCISLAGEANSRSLLARMTDDIDGRISHPSPTLFCAGVRVATVLPPRTMA